MITSAAHREWAGDVVLSDLGATGLVTASIVRTAKIATIEASNATVIGLVSGADRGRVRAELARLMDPVWA